MTLRFHISTPSIRVKSTVEQTEAPTEPMIPVAPETKPRGASHETWRRARGWSSED